MTPERVSAPRNKGPRKPRAEELAHDAVAHEKAAPGDQVETAFRVPLAKPSRRGTHCTG